MSACWHHIKNVYYKEIILRKKDTLGSHESLFIFILEEQRSSHIVK